MDSKAGVRIPAKVGISFLVLFQLNWMMIKFHSTSIDRNNISFSIV